MRNKLLLVGVALAGVTLVSAPAEASVKVIGGGLGRQCYEYARAGHASDSGIEVCNQALAERSLSEEDRAATLVNRGILQMYAKQNQLALESYESALRLNPNLAEAYVNKGVVLVNLGRDSEAVAAASQALELKTERPEIAYYTRGVAHEMLGNMRAAYRDYRQASELKPEWQEPQTQLQRFSVLPKARG
jgi:tetratricopeptide (TPR) repeat protein